MCELLVRVVDKVNAQDPRKNAQLTKRGDVITVQEDGWPWSAAELAGNPWRVIAVPGVPADVVSAFLQPEPYDPVVDHKLPQRRAFKFDIDAFLALPAGTKLTRAQALALKITKPPIPDPDVLVP